MNDVWKVIYTNTPLRTDRSNETKSQFLISQLQKKTIMFSENKTTSPDDVKLSVNDYVQGMWGPLQRLAM